MKIVSYNVNGIRAAHRKGLLDWLKVIDADIVCLQEIKSNQDQILEIQEELINMGYFCFWNSAQKKGYSGTAILSKEKPKHVEYGCGIDIYDSEGRILRADYTHFSIMSLYMPSGSSGDERQDFKFQFLHDFKTYVKELRQDFPHLIISGDYNICHTEIDIHNPVANKNSSGFLLEERQWFSKFLKEEGMIDSFRHFNQSPHHYTWWSYRAGARKKNLGWRIDYNLVSNTLESKLKNAIIFNQIIHSDHCPLSVEILA